MKLLLSALFFTASLSAEDGKPESPEEGLRVQIFLDQKLFGPGFLDGNPGNFTERAVYAYNRSQGRSPGDWAAILEDALKEVPNLYAVASVPGFAGKYVNPKLSPKREKQAKEKMMSYRSYLEFMAERYHTSGTFLIQLNGTQKAHNLGPRSTLKVPNIEPFRIEELAAGRSHKADEKLSLRTVIIDTGMKQLFIYDPAAPVKVAPGVAVAVADDEEEEPVGQLIAMFPTTPGQEKFIHRGHWKIRNCVELPEWRYDKSFLEKGKRSNEYLQIPPGPNNPVGVLWSGLTKAGIGIHGTSSPRTIGRAQSAGCYRLANWDAARFSSLTRPGTKVIVR
ncbi:L,D-transpeptidase [Akkermansiaceae bacterium]|nr:L,D-transpeptidase [Akkermansiaceae bacterium]